MRLLVGKSTRLIKTSGSALDEASNQTGKLLLLGTTQRKPVLDFCHSLVKVALEVSWQVDSDQNVTDVFEKRYQTDAFVSPHVVDFLSEYPTFVSLKNVVACGENVEDSIDVCRIWKTSMLEHIVSIDNQL